jgi:hypothetical protein
VLGVVGLLGVEAGGLLFSLGELEAELLSVDESIEESIDESAESLSIVSLEDDEMEESIDESDEERESAAQAAKGKVKESANIAIGIHFNFFIVNTPFF